MDCAVLFGIRRGLQLRFLKHDCEIRMSELLPLELNQQQRDVLIRGLRYVRSSVMLTTQDLTPELEQARAEELRQLAELTSILKGEAVTQESPV